MLLSDNCSDKSSFVASDIAICVTIDNVSISLLGTRGTGVDVLVMRGVDGLVVERGNPVKLRGREVV